MHEKSWKLSYFQENTTSSDFIFCSEWFAWFLSVEREMKQLSNVKVPNNFFIIHRVTLDLLGFFSSTP